MVTGPLQVQTVNTKTYDLWLHPHLEPMKTDAALIQVRPFKRHFAKCLLQRLSHQLKLFHFSNNGSINALMSEQNSTHHTALLAKAL